MIESMHKYMKVGLIHPMAFPATLKGEGPILETLKTICTDDYFDAVELTYVKDEETADKVKAMLEQSGMAVGYAGQPILLTRGLNVNDLCEEKRIEAVENLKSGIDQAIRFGAQGFGFLAGKYAQETIEQSFEALVKSADALCEYAKAKGNIKILLEVFDYDIDKQSLIGPVTLAKRFAELMTQKHDNFGLMVDLSHIPMLRETLEENLVPIQEYILHAHMGNTVIQNPAATAYGDTHPRFDFPNSENGVKELTAYLRKLMEIGFLCPERRPIVSFEVKPWADEDPDVIIANSKRFLNLAWANV